MFDEPFTVCEVHEEYNCGCINADRYRVVVDV